MDLNTMMSNRTYEQVMFEIECGAPLNLERLGRVFGHEEIADLVDLMNESEEEVR